MRQNSTFCRLLWISHWVYPAKKSIAFGFCCTFGFFHQYSPDIVGIGEVDPSFVRFLLDIDRLNHTTPGQDALKYIIFFGGCCFANRGVGGNQNYKYPSIVLSPTSNNCHKISQIAWLEGRQSVAVTKWQFGEYSKRTQLTRPILNLVKSNVD